MFVVIIVLAVFFLLFFPFWHVGGHYYRGVILIYDIRPKSGGGFLPPLPFEKDVTLLKWADPTSFEYVGDSYAKDRFYVYSKYRLEGFDSNTFRPIQAPITGERFYTDKNNVRIYDTLVLKLIAGDSLVDSKNIVTDKFDIESFQLLGASLIKDKNGIYTHFSSAPFTEDMHSNGWDNRTIELFKKQGELDIETFKVDFCNDRVCQASDKNGNYIINLIGSSRFAKIKKIG